MFFPRSPPCAAACPSPLPFPCCYHHCHCPQLSWEGGRLQSHSCLTPAGLNMKLEAATGRFPAPRLEGNPGKTRWKGGICPLLPLLLTESGSPCSLVDCAGVALELTHRGSQRHWQWWEGKGCAAEHGGVGWGMFSLSLAASLATWLTERGLHPHHCTPASTCHCNCHVGEAAHAQPAW